MTTRNIYELAQTWNNVAVDFTAIKMNVTDTASASTSKLLDLQVGGSSKFAVEKSGSLQVPSTGWYVNLDASTGSRITLNNGAFSVGNDSGVSYLSINYNANTTTLHSSHALCWGSSATGAQDVFVRRDAANTLAQRNGVNAQTFNIYNTYTDASNYERGFIKWSSNVLEIGTESAGTGATRKVRVGPKGNNSTLEIGPNFGTSGGTNILIAKCGASTVISASDFSTTISSGGNGLVLSPPAAAGVEISGTFLELGEIVAPSGLTNKARIYAEDDGSGKTRLMVQFQSGAAQQIAIEP